MKGGDIVVIAPIYTLYSKFAEEYDNTIGVVCESHVHHEGANRKRVYYRVWWASGQSTCWYRERELEIVKSGGQNDENRGNN